MTAETIKFLMSLITLGVVLIYIIPLISSRKKLFPEVYIGHMYAVEAIILFAIGFNPLVSIILCIMWYFSYYLTLSNEKSR